MTDKPAQLHTAAEIDLELEVVDFVAGRMDAESQADFEARMESDPELASRVADERRFSEDIVQAVPSEAPPATAFERIRPEVESRSRMPRWLPAAAAAGLVGVALLFMVPPGDDTGFRVLEDGPEQAVSIENRYRIVFSEGSTDSERAAVAERLGFGIISGPGAGGSYVVETIDAVSRDQLVEWRSEDAIELAEPIVYSSEP